MYRLIYAERSAAYSSRIILKEIGADYELIMTGIEDGGPRHPELMKLNPNGWVPVLIDGDMAIHEAAAIVIYLTDKHPECGLAPAPGDPARGPFLTWLVYMSNTVQTAYQLMYYPGRYCTGGEHTASVQQRSCERLRETWGYIDAALEGKTWFVGETFSAADIYLHMLTTWLSPDAGHPTIDEFPNAKRIADAVAKRPAVRLVHRL
ncbi:MAG: glutathione S-transferase family protein [Alphaproteobacteria bacterium]|nr:glutathione S-transferase family protein [Rhodospirillaceae bacterium]MBT6202476.1 glutathione S-transferase family protein [Rhodospirillaceae bacterium]MBT6511337.1 glutathione S-transferase family protein [Rhodospirillaceae bacterium]MDG2481351.1 glutathione S-transferase family protein [Alphaproteobacteria bacterium]